MSEAIRIYKSSMMGLNELYIITDKEAPFFGWLMFKHPDGQLVSLADLKPHVDAINPTPACTKLVEELKEIKRSMFPPLPDWEDNHPVRTSTGNYRRLAALIERLQEEE